MGWHGTQMSKTFNIALGLSNSPENFRNKTRRMGLGAYALILKFAPLSKMGLHFQDPQIVRIEP